MLGLLRVNTTIRASQGSTASQIFNIIHIDLDVCSVSCTQTIFHLHLNVFIAFVLKDIVRIVCHPALMSNSRQQFRHCVTGKASKVN